MKKYVLGFAFNDNFVLLIEKKRPKWQSGLYNGLGGHIKKNEEPISAMVREFKEECGIESKESDWEQYAIMKGNDWICYCFRSSNQVDLASARQTTDEHHRLFNVYVIQEVSAISNVPALIHLARDVHNPQMTTLDYTTPFE